LDALLGAFPRARTPLDSLRTNSTAAGILLIPADFAAPTNQPSSFRVARLPCIQEGLLAGGDGVGRLLRPYAADSELAVREIEFGWHHHPEALMPVLGGMLLENQQPRTGPPLSTIMRRQARLYQMGADSPSMIPQVGRLARYLATRTEFELAMQRETNWVADRTACLGNIARAVAAPEISPAEGQAYFQFALGLGDLDLAAQSASLLEKCQPDNPATRRCRIQVNLAQGAFGQVLDQINRLLNDHPNDSWALAQRQAALSGIKTLLDSTKIYLKPNP
jgi:hypothetical protein